MHQSTLSAPPFSDYGFDQIIQIVGRADCYRPNDLGDRAVERIQRSISGKTRGKSASIAMFVRDLMEELLAPEVDWVCPNCNAQFGLLLGCVDASQHLLVCRVCRASRWAGGSTLSGQRVRYREASELDAWEQV